MVYSHERLIRLHDLFPVPHFTQRRQDLRDCAIQQFLGDEALKSRRRLGVSDLRSANTLVWLDKDDSGDYNPLAEARPNESRSTKRKRPTTVDAHAIQGRKTKQAKRTWIAGRQRGDVLKISLKLKSGDGIKLLQKMKETGKTNISSREASVGESPSLWRLSGGSFSSTRTSLSSFPSQRIFSTEIAPRSAVKVLNCSSNKTSSQADSKEQSKPQVIKPALPKSNKSLAPLKWEIPFNKTIKITTSWAHPIDFRHIDSPQNPCSFCKDYRYGLLGLGTLHNVEVRQVLDEFQEVGGGHRERGLRPTKMCRSCAYERLHIVRCPGHDIIELSDLNEADFDHQTVLDHLFNQEPGSEEPISLWCSICITPAFYGCCTAQRFDMYGRPTSSDSEDFRGCGLVLCSECAEAVRCSRGDLAAMKKGLDSGTKNLRADLEFLDAKGFLAQAYRTVP
ncbi:MAG: hypothetical protein Q9227_001619 [Pyrenula ochraceoflavens]